MPIKQGGMRDYQDPIQNTLNLLESDQPLPDDDPRSRNGGLKPNRKQDIPQIQMYVQLRQSGQISDTAWQRLMQRNPESAVLLSQVQSPQQPYQQYFSPGQAEKPFVDEQAQFMGAPQPQGLVAQAATPAKFDYEGGMAAALGRGDTNMVNSLINAKGGGAESPFAKINPKDYSQESVRTFAKTGDFSALVPTVDKVDRDAKEAARSDIGFKQEGQLRDDFTKLAAPFIQVRDSYGRIQESAKNPSAAGDLALVFNYMKMLDPGSTVREGEFATAQNSAGIPDRVRAMYNKSINGERLADTTRKDFVTRSDMLYKRQLNSHKKLESQFKGMAKKYNLDPDRTVPDYTSDTPANSPSSSLPPGWSIKQR